MDDWLERVPVTERKVDVFEAWFGDILDELLGSPYRPHLIHWITTLLALYRPLE